MTARWSADSVLALAPDDSSRRAAATLARPGQWETLWKDGAGAADDLVWGLCAGSAKNPYQVIVDLAGPAFKCSCPSRKFPCKHALALLLLWSAGTVPDEREPADYARTWHEARQSKAERSRASSRTDAADSDAPADSPASADDGAGFPAASEKSRAAAKRRAAERAQRVTDGLADLREWLRDQVRAGLAASGQAGGGPAGAGAAELMAARMIDAQAPGVAAALRGLSGAVVGGAVVGGAATGAASGGAASGGGPGGLLAEYALLHLLIRAHERLDQLPEGLAAVVRSRIGYPVSKDDVLAGPAVTDQWLVLAVRELTDGQVPGRRIWLRGRKTQRWAMLLTFAAPNGAWQDLATARLRPGTELHADLHYYPGQPPLRAVIGTRHADPARTGSMWRGPAGPEDGIDAQLTHWSAALEQDPWLTTWPVLLSGTVVSHGNEWHLVDRAGAALPLAYRESLWTLLAVSGGDPVTVAGEWHPNGLVALTTWHGDEAVAL